ncbi:MAG: DUF4349 domain-containing protein [Polyangiaceae bacterium]
MLKRVTRAVGALLLSVATASAIGCAAYEPARAASPKSAPGRWADEAPAASAAPMMEMGGLAGGLHGADMDGAVATNGPAPAPTSTSTPPGQSQAYEQHGPMLVYTATLNLAVFQVAEASKEVEKMAREAGGFLARRDDTSLTIRIPVAKFEDMMKRLEKLGDVLHRNVVAEDVTEQFMDAEVRLKNARAVRDRLQQLLDKATKVEDSLAIEKELTRVGTDIETLEGKLKYLRDRAMFSTITVSFQPKQTDNVKANAVRMPVDWLDNLGLGRLLSL